MGVSRRKHSPQDCLPIWRWVIKAPELWGGAFEAKANFGSAALLLTEVDDLAVLLLAVGDISRDDPFAQSDGRRQSSETTVTTEHNCACRISECAFVGGLALYDHRQLRHPLAVSVVGPCGSKHTPVR